MQDKIALAFDLVAAQTLLIVAAVNGRFFLAGFGLNGIVAICCGAVAVVLLAAAYEQTRQ